MFGPPDPTYVCPLTEWSRDRLEKQIVNLIALLDWRPRKQAGQEESQMSAYHYCCRHFEYMLPDEFDATLDNLFWCHWSRKLIKQGNTLVINPVWGLRKKPDRKDIPPYILRAASAEIVNPIIKAIRPQPAAHICLPRFVGAGILEPTR